VTAGQAIFLLLPAHFAIVPTQFAFRTGHYWTTFPKLAVGTQPALTRSGTALWSKRAFGEKDMAKRRSTSHAAGNRRWSADVTKHSDALDLEKGVFKLADPHKIALSLKRSAENSSRRKGGPYQSAMSMLNFYINRAGSGLSQKQMGLLLKSKGELRKVFHKENN
jgi:hypothetical protein